jgi:hypothetical protein
MRWAFRVESDKLEIAVIQEPANHIRRHGYDHAHNLRDQPHLSAGLVCLLGMAERHRRQSVALNPSSVHVNREGYSSFQLHPIISNSSVAHRHRIFASEARFWLITDAPIVAGYGCTVTRLFNDLWGRYRRNVRKSPYCVTQAACRTSSSCEPSLIMVFPRYSPSRRATWLLGICRSG